jgi:guanylate kinase
VSGREEQGDNGADLVVISGPSGVGKSSMTQLLLKREPKLRFSVSATTRAPRPGEQDGVDYHFVTRAEFDELLRRGGLIEHAEVFGELYGTPVAELEAARRAGRMLLLEIDVQGGMQIRRKFPAALEILLVPPSLEALRQRLAGRGTETAETMARRFAEAQSELDVARRSGAYTSEVVNDKLDRAAEDVVRLIENHRRTR